MKRPAGHTPVTRVANPTNHRPQHFRRPLSSEELRAVAPSQSSTDGANEQRSSEHRAVAEEWNDLVESIRALSGFEDFLRPMSFRDLATSSKDAAVVILNVSIHRCDAIIIRHAGQLLDTVPLVTLTVEKVHIVRDHFVATRDISRRGEERYSKRVQADSRPVWERTLHWLWEHVCSHVLAVLNVKGTSSENYTAIRVRWCPTGPLTPLPIHAARRRPSQAALQPHPLDAHECDLLKMVASSYITSLSGFLQSQGEPSEFKMLVVAQPSAEGQAPLPCAGEELSIIRTATGGRTFSALERQGATVAKVLEQLQDATWVHFASHAIQNQADPMQSAVHLHDGVLTIAQIAAQYLRGADLAVLLACETGRGSAILPDEALHLAAGMQLAGFRGVVATLWAMGDKDGPTVARVMYEYLYRNTDEPSSGDAAEALRRAVLYLRDVDNVPFQRWLPFVHFGY